MKKIAMVVIFLFTFVGCAKEQSATQKSASVTSAQEVKPVGSLSTTISVKAVEVGSPEAVTQEGSGLQVAPPEAIVQEMQAKVKEAQQQTALVNPVEGAESSIAENRWGFSIYDPKTGIEGFYTSKGFFLGEKKR